MKLFKVDVNVRYPLKFNVGLLLAFCTQTDVYHIILNGKKDEKILDCNICVLVNSMEW